MYKMYIDKILLPVTPKSLTIDKNNRNKVITLLSDGEVNELKTPGLATIKFNAEFPNSRYPYARYDGDFKRAEYFIKKFEKIRANKKPVQFVLIREKLFNTNIKVVIDGMTFKEDADQGTDIVLSFVLKEYKYHGIKTYKLKDENTAQPLEISRDTSTAPLPKSSQAYVVKNGDSLWAIAKYFYGDGAKYPVIFNANQDKISNPSLIYTGQVLTIPAI